MRVIQLLHYLEYSVHINIFIEITQLRHKIKGCCFKLVENLISDIFHFSVHFPCFELLTS